MKFEADRLIYPDNALGVKFILSVTVLKINTQYAFHWDHEPNSEEVYFGWCDCIAKIMEAKQ